MSSEFAIFIVASMAIAVVPGPDILYLVGRGVSQGRSAAISSALGINTGAAIHAGLAAVGLSAMIQQNEVLFVTIRYLGAAYLVYLAVTTVLQRDRDADAHDYPARHAFVQGVVTDLLNPKVYLFFLAFLPQFVDPRSGSVMVQTVVLGMVFVAVNLPIDLAVAWGSASLGDIARRRSRATVALRWLSSGILVALAVRVVRDQ